MPKGGARRRSGPPPQPTALKVLRGNPGRRPLNDREPKPDLDMPSCPRELSDIAKREWKRIVHELHKLGMMTAIDRAALAGYCAVYGDFIEAEARIRQVGNLRKGSDGEVKISPLFRMRNTALDLMHRYLIEFGMSPSSRSRVKADIARATEELPADEAFLASRGLRVVK